MPHFLFLHAHPDDEAIGSGGTIAAALTHGHRVTVVFATAGERGESPSDLDGTLGERRIAEAHRAAAELGGARVEFLGYRDSGVSADGAEGTFAAADLDEAARRLVELVWSVGADALIGYEPEGVTGHPDHVQVHRVGRRAIELLGEAAPRYYEGTLRREQVELVATMVLSGGGDPAAVRLSASAAEQIAVTLDVRGWLDRKRRAMAAHASQIPANSFFLSLGEAEFAALWGAEHYRDPFGADVAPGPVHALAAAVAR